MQFTKSSIFKSLAAIAMTSLLAGQSAWAQVDTLASIKQKGKIVVGVKADYKPFGYVDPAGKIVGFEIDMANEIAKKLGVQIEVIPVVAANRMEFVKQGRTDLMIATMSYKPDRAEVLAIPEPFYYASAAAVLAKKNSGLKAWAELKGKTICGIQGAYYNRRTGDEFGAKLLTFKGSTEALAALEAGNCVGFVFDSTFFAGVTSEPKWADYAIMLPLIQNLGEWACVKKILSSQLLLVTHLKSGIKPASLSAWKRSGVFRLRLIWLNRTPNLNNFFGNRPSA